jgi:thymidylate kinase
MSPINEPDDVPYISSPDLKPLSHGMIVALIGPDGVGKSSQTAQLTSIFQMQNLKCTAIYLGSGEGGWRLRRAAKRQFRKWRGKVAESGSGAKGPTPKEYGTNHSVWTGMSGLAAALERYVSLRRAVRLAGSGSLVICDRWPQNIQPGFFDGPLRLDPQASWAVRLMSQLERSVFRRMETYRPNLTIHLVNDFNTSNARKPGDRTRDDFDQRLALMQKMRAMDASIITIDASRDFEEVTQDLLNCICRTLASPA